MSKKQYRKSYNEKIKFECHFYTKVSGSQRHELIHQEGLHLLYNPSLNIVEGLITKRRVKEETETFLSTVPTKLWKILKRVSV